MGISRVKTSRGAIISFDRRGIDVSGKKVTIKSSQELIKAMSEVSKLFVEDPIDGNIKRMWVVKGRKLYTKPNKKFIIGDDDEGQ